MQERIQKIIAGAGLCSRRKAEDLIATAANRCPLAAADRAEIQRILDSADRHASRSIGETRR